MFWYCYVCSPDSEHGRVWVDGFYNNSEVIFNSNGISTPVSDMRWLSFSQDPENNRIRIDKYNYYQNLAGTNEGSYACEIKQNDGID